jgi:hypothetical protein
MRASTLAVLAIVACGLGDSRQESITSVGSVQMIGEWDDGENFSGVVIVGDTVILASDEVGFVQVGRRTEAAGVVTIRRTGKIALADDPNVEMDVEALAQVGTLVYGIGSHSATRSRSDDESRRYETNRERLVIREIERHPERELLFRFTLDAEAGTAADLRTTSLRTAILSHAVLRPFADAAGKENGIDIEGLAAKGETLFVGFRGPVLRHGFAPVTRLTFESPDDNELLFVPLDGRGVRDLAAVSDGVLVLAGPAGDSDQPHRLYWWNGLDCVPGRDNAGGRLRWLGEVPSAADGKAEALAVVAETAAAYTVVVFYDSRPNGEPRRLRVPRTVAGQTAATALCGSSR